MDAYEPTRIIVGRPRATASANSSGGSRLLRMIRKEAKRRAMTMAALSGGEARAFFAKDGCKTKHAIARLLATWFEELARQLPPKRKPWHSERYNTLVFDAAASAVAFFGRA